MSETMCASGKKSVANSVAQPVAQNVLDISKSGLTDIISSEPKEVLLAMRKKMEEGVFSPSQAYLLYVSEILPYVAKAATARGNGIPDTDYVRLYLSAHTDMKQISDMAKGVRPDEPRQIYMA